MRTAWIIAILFLIGGILDSLFRTGEYEWVPFYIVAIYIAKTKMPSKAEQYNELN